MAWGSPLDASVTVLPGAGGDSGLLTGVELADNTLTALSVGEGANDYVTFTTLDGAEEVTVLKNVHFHTGISLFCDTISEQTADTGVTIDGLAIKDFDISFNSASVSSGDARIVLKDNLASSLVITESGNAYITFDTTNNAEFVRVSQPMVINDGISGGNARRIGGTVLSEAVASTAIPGSNEAETAFDRNVVLATGVLRVGTTVRIRASGMITLENATEKLQFKVRLGTTIIAQVNSNLLDPSADNESWGIDFEFTVRSTGASGTIVGEGLCWHGQRGAANSGLYGLFTGSTSTSTTVVDTTGTNNVNIAVDYAATTDDTTSSRLDRLVVTVNS